MQGMSRSAPIVLSRILCCVALGASLGPAVEPALAQGITGSTAESDTPLIEPGSPVREQACKVVTDGPRVPARHMTRETLLAERRAQIAADGQIKVRSDRVLEALNPVRGLRTQFRSTGVRVTPLENTHRASDPTASPTHVDVRLVGLGRGSAAKTPRDAPPTFLANRVEYDRGQLLEWYVNDERGLEQGFTLRQPPEGEGSIELQLELETELRPIRSNDGAAIDFYSIDHRLLLTCGDLLATDATGRMLESEMRLEGEAIILAVEDAEAVYPVTIDPTWNLGLVILPPPEASAQFGAAVAVNGDTIVVGDPGAFAGAKGGVFIYHRSGSTLDFQTGITTADGQSVDFGAAVAISGDVAFIGDPSWSGSQGRLLSLVRTNGVWSTGFHQWAISILGHTPGPNDRFAAALAVDGSRVVLGAPGVNAGDGLVMTFFHVNGAADGRLGNGWGFLMRHSSMGASVAIQGDQFVTGLPTITTLDGGVIPGGWLSVALEWESTSSVAYALFVRGDTGFAEAGTSVAVNGDGRVAIGAPGGGQDNPGVGTVLTMQYFAEETDPSRKWRVVHSIEPAGGSASNGSAPRFGQSVALGGGRIAIGGPDTNINGGPTSGAAWVSDLGSDGVQLASPRLESPTPTAGAKFGGAIALYNDLCVVGQTSPTGPGRVHVFLLDGTLTGTRVYVDRMAIDGNGSQSFPYTTLTQAASFVPLSATDPTVAEFTRSGSYNASSGETFPLTINKNMRLEAPNVTGIVHIGN